MNTEPTTHCPMCGKAKRKRGVYCRPCGFIARRPYNRAWAKANYDADPKAKLEKVRQWREANPEKCAKGARASYAKNAAKYRERFKDYYRNNPAKKKATSLVNNTIASGRLTRQPCQICGEAKTQAHHDSYLKENWLNLRWLCRKHHMAWHRVFLPELPEDFTNPRERAVSEEKPDGWVVWRDDMSHPAFRSGASVYHDKSVAEVALHRAVHYQEPRFTGIFYNCEAKLAELGWRIRPVKLLFLDEPGAE